MSASFKHKPSRLKYLTVTQTVDELHRNKIAKFDTNLKSIPEKKKRISELKSQIKTLCQSSEDLETMLPKKIKLQNEIDDLTEEIKKASNHSEIIDYINKTGDLLIDYYDITCGTTSVLEDKDKIIDITNIAEEKNNTQCQDENTVSEQTETIGTGIFISEKLKYLNQLSQQSRKIKKPVKKRRLAQNIPTVKSILQFLPEPVTGNVIEKTEKQTISRATLQDKYLMLVDKNYACEKSRASNILLCSQCDIEKILIHAEGRYVCKICGETEILLMENETPNNKDMTCEKQKYPYKKSNHLREKLNQFQSKESVDVPEEICNIIRADLKKRRIREETCTPQNIRSILKKHRLTAYYEHLQQIYCKITKTEPITLSREIEETVLAMFQMMQEPFHKHCPANRSNFLSYSYALNKIFRILKMNQHAKYFSLLKSKEKLREQDNIWSKICKDLGWHFHSSF